MCCGAIILPQFFCADAYRPDHRLYAFAFSLSLLRFILFDHHRLHVMPSPIKTCVLGTGLSGLTFHIPFVLALPNLFSLHAVLERSPHSEGGRVKQRFGVTTKIHRSFEEVLTDQEIELVIVGTPNATHFEYAKRCLEAGRHVLVEKPVCTTADEARQLENIASEKKLVLYAYQNRRWDSDFMALKSLLEQPTDSSSSLGDLVEFETQ